MVVEALIWDKLINKKAFGACNAASQQFHEIFVMDFAYQIDFVEEMINPLRRIVEKPLHGNSLSIRQNPLFKEKNFSSISSTHEAIIYRPLSFHIE